ncbi:MAG: FecR domain-containing protein [Cyclobacteriaceae bacterium]
MNDEHITEELLTKYLAGEADLDERAMVEKWSGESSQNREELNQLSMIYTDLGAIRFDQNEKELPTFDSVAAFKKVKQRRDQSKSSPRISWFAIAASIGLLIIASWWLFVKNEAPTKVQVAQEENQIEEAMPDGSLVTVNQSSSIAYQKSDFLDHRKVVLEGEAYFEVTHDETNPFEVHTSNMVVRVLGTAFNVNDKADTSIIAVTSGKVMVMANAQNIVLTKGMVGVYRKASGELLVHNASTTGLTYWKTKTLSFDKTPLSEVIEVINAAYNVEIVLANPNIASCPLSVVFADEQLENILEVISVTIGVDLRREGQTILFDGEGC